VSLPDPHQWPVEEPFADRTDDVDSSEEAVSPNDIRRPDDPGAVGDLLRERTRSTPDATAVIDADAGEQWTYGEFDDRVSRRVERLEGRFGVEAGRAGLLLDTSVAFADVYFATERRAGAVVPLNLDLPTETLRTQAERAEIDCLFCESDTEELATEVAPADVPVASVDAPGRDEVTSLEPRTDAATWPFEQSLDADRVVLFTSGTTGDPKGVRLTRWNLVASAVGSAYRLGVDPDDRWLAPLPMYHMGGLAPLVRSTLYGTTTVIQRSFDAESTARVMADYDVTGVSLVPTMLVRLLDADWTPPESLRFVLLGGAPASGQLLDRALDRGIPVYPTYGATETASQVATATPDEVREYSGTVGRPLRGTDVSIRDVTDCAVGTTDSAAETTGPGERGEVVVSGPTVTPGYLDEGQTATAFDEDGGFHTGDVGYRDDAGRLWVVGRLDDRIVTGGENVHPADVTEALVGLPDVADAAVVGLPDEEWGERVAALVVPADQDDPPTADEMRAGLRGRVADYALPKSVACTDELPRTASGTVDRDAVRSELSGGVDRE